MHFNKIYGLEKCSKPRKMKGNNNNNNNKKETISTCAYITNRALFYLHMCRTLKLMRAKGKTRKKECNIYRLFQKFTSAVSVPL